MVTPVCSVSLHTTCFHISRPLTSFRHPRIGRGRAWTKSVEVSPLSHFVAIFWPVVRLLLVRAYFTIRRHQYSAVFLFKSELPDSVTGSSSRPNKPGLIRSAIISLLPPGFSSGSGLVYTLAHCWRLDPLPVTSTRTYHDQKQSSSSRI